MCRICVIACAVWGDVLGFIQMLVKFFGVYVSVLVIFVLDGVLFDGYYFDKVKDHILAGGKLY